MEFELLQFFEAFHNPLVFGAMVAGVVKLIRDAAPVIDGKLVVALVTAVVGGAIGVGFDLFDVLAYEPVANFPNMVGGLIYGVLGGLTGFLEVNLLDLVFRRKGKEEPVGTSQAIDDVVEDAALGKG